MASDEPGSDVVKQGRVAVARAVRALRDVVAAIDAGEVPDSRALRNYLVGVVVTLETLSAEQNQEPVQ